MLDIGLCVLLFLISILDAREGLRSLIVAFPARRRFRGFLLMPYSWFNPKHVFVIRILVCMWPSVVSCVLL